MITINCCTINRIDNNDCAFERNFGDSILNIFAQIIGRIRTAVFAGNHVTGCAAFQRVRALQSCIQIIRVLNIQRIAIRIDDTQTRQCCATHTNSNADYFLAQRLQSPDFVTVVTKGAVTGRYTRPGDLGLKNCLLLGICPRRIDDITQIIQITIRRTVTHKIRIRIRARNRIIGACTLQPVDR